MRGIEESFGRDTTYIETGSSKSASLLDANSFETSLSCLDGGNVSYLTQTNEVLQTINLSNRQYSPPGPPPMTATSYSFAAKLILANCMNVVGLRVAYTDFVKYIVFL